MNLKLVEEFNAGNKALNKSYYVDENGLKQGMLKEFDTYKGKNEISKIINYKDDKKNGIAEEYIGGDLTGFKTYEDDVLNGPYQVKDYRWKEPSTLNTGNYKNGRRDGLIETYYLYKDGTKKIASRGEYKEGVRQGQHERWHENGKQEFIGTYDENGKAVGTHTSYFWNGNKQKEVVYSEDGKRKDIEVYFSHGGMRAKRTEISGNRSGWSYLYASKDGAVLHRIFNENGKSALNPETEEEARMVIFLKNKGYAIEPPIEKQMEYKKKAHRKKQKRYER